MVSFPNIVFRIACLPSFQKSVYVHMWTNYFAVPTIQKVHVYDDSQNNIDTHIQNLKYLNGINLYYPRKEKLPSDLDKIIQEATHTFHINL